MAANFDAEHIRSAVQNEILDLYKTIHWISEQNSLAVVHLACLAHAAKAQRKIRHSQNRPKYSPARIARIERESVGNLGSAFTSLGGDFCEVPGRIKVRSGVKYHATLACQQR